MASNADIAQLRREIAELRGTLSVIHAALALGPDETMGSMAGRLRRELDDAGTTARQAMDNVHILFGNTIISQDGRAWSPLPMPAGAAGTARFRPASDGHLQVHLDLTWGAAPGTVQLAGVPRELCPAAPWADGGFSIDTCGLITITVTGTACQATVLVPLR